MAARFITEKDVEAEYGLGKAWQRRARMFRRIPFIKLARKVLYERQAIEAFINARRVPAKDQPRRPAA